MIEKTRLDRRSRRFGALAALALAMAVSGCSDGVELNGKLFDMMGVSAAAQAAKSTEPTMPVRTGLVLPPDSSRLPEPGSGQAADTASQTVTASVVDPETKKEQAAKDRAELHRRYCSGELSWKDRAFDPSAPPTSPYGPCGMMQDALQKH